MPSRPKKSPLHHHEQQTTSAKRPKDDEDKSVFHPPRTPRIETRNEEASEPPPELSYAPTSLSKKSSIFHPPTPVLHSMTSESSGMDRYRAAYASDYAQIRKNQQFAKAEMMLSQSQVVSSSSQITESDLEQPSTFETSGTEGTATDDDDGSKRQRQQRRTHIMAFSSSTDASQHLLADELQLDAEDDYFSVKQPFGYCSIAVSSIQLLILIMQLLLCGVAPLDVNPLVGPYPDAFSEWGGKNVYFIVQEWQLWRFVTPAFLHVGVLHLLCNALVQLEAVAFFEREWGSKRWLILYLLSEVGCIVTSCVFSPDTIAVGSSGALMGLFGAKFAQLLQYMLFEMSVSSKSRIRLEQVSGILCSLSIVSVLSFMTYVDWSGHWGGFATGFFAGMPAFSRPIRSSATRFLWSFFGLSALGAGLYLAFSALYTVVEPDPDLADACEYFRNLFAEGYNCECLWG